MTTLLVLFMLLMQGMYAGLHIRAWMIVIIEAIAIFLYSIIKNGRIRIKSRTLMFSIILIILQIITILVNGFSVEFDIISLSTIAIACLWFSNMSFKDFVESYKKIILVLSLISVVLYYIGLFTDAYSYIPGFLLQETNSEHTFTLLGTFVLTQRFQYMYYRNCCIFSEPGQFQIYLSIGLIFELFYSKGVNWKHLVVYLLAYVTADSTNGFLTLIFIILAFVVQRGVRHAKSSRRIKKVIVVCFVALISGLVLFGPGELLQESLEKLSGLFEDYTYTSLGTGLERRRAFDLAINMTLKNPITGLGYTGVHNYIYGLSSTKIIVTFTPLNWFAYFGFLYGIIANVCFLASLTKCKGTLSRMLLIIGLLVMISAQSVMNATFILFFMMYGWERINPMEEKTIQRSHELQYEKSIGQLC